MIKFMWTIIFKVCHQFPGDDRLMEHRLTDMLLGLGKDYLRHVGITVPGSCFKIGEQGGGNGLRKRRAVIFVHCIL